MKICPTLKASNSSFVVTGQFSTLKYMDLIQNYMYYNEDNSIMTDGAGFCTGDASSCIREAHDSNFTSIISTEDGITPR
jgi:hypothetical protein